MFTFIATDKSIIGVPIDSNFSILIFENKIKYRLRYFLDYIFFFFYLLDLSMYTAAH